MSQTRLDVQRTLNESRSEVGQQQRWWFFHRVVEDDDWGQICLGWVQLQGVQTEPVDMLSDSSPSPVRLQISDGSLQVHSLKQWKAHTGIFFFFKFIDQRL